MLEAGDSQTFPEAPPTLHYHSLPYVVDRRCGASDWWSFFNGPRADSSQTPLDPPSPPHPPTWMYTSWPVLVGFCVQCSCLSGQSWWRSVGARDAMSTYLSVELSAHWSCTAGPYPFFGACGKVWSLRGRECTKGYLRIWNITSEHNPGT